MKKLAVIAVAVILMTSCGGGDFANVGKNFKDIQERYNYELINPGTYACGYSIFNFKNGEGKIGSVTSPMENVYMIAVPASFEAVSVLNCKHTLFLVTKDGKKGVVKAFEKGFFIPCEYKSISMDKANKSILLQKEGGEPEEYRL
jgi:hypothetical protein